MLKRFIYFVVALVCLALLIPTFNLAAISTHYPDAEYSFYVNSLPKALPSTARVAKNGAGYIVSDRKSVV